MGIWPWRTSGKTFWNSGFLGYEFANHDCLCANWLAVHLGKIMVFLLGSYSFLLSQMLHKIEILSLTSSPCRGDLNSDTRLRILKLVVVRRRTLIESGQGVINKKYQPNDRYFASASFLGASAHYSL